MVGVTPARDQADETACPCGSGGTFGACCGPFIVGRHRPASAEQLMRSRYTAFVRRDVWYLLDTWHPSVRPADLNLDEPVKWLGLRILRVEAGGRDDREGMVEFVARYRVGGDPAGRLREASCFVREAGRWLYLGGGAAGG